MISSREIIHLGVAFLVLVSILSFSSLVAGQTLQIGNAMLNSFLLLSFVVIGRKIMASALDSNVEHEIWFWSRYGLKPGWHTPKPIPLGVLLPAIITAFTLGTVKCMALLTYETSALKRRAARKFGYYSFTEMTDWHNALVGAGGIIAAIILAMVSYLIPKLIGLPTLATYYALWNMIPFSKLDGSQIFFGSRILYTVLLLITLAMTLLTLAIV